MDFKSWMGGMGIKGFSALLALVLIFAASFYFVNAVPQGASVQGTPSVDAGPTKSPYGRNDSGGRIITANFNLEQQNGGWKAYVGNVSGSYVLQNAVNESIYEWPLSSVAGELYVSRDGSLTFGSVTCANQATMDADHVILGMAASNDDSINKTFNSTTHTPFNVGTTPLSGCPSTALWVNDTVQTQGASATWQEVLLNVSGSLVYASILNNDRSGFTNTTTYDFQAIVAENRTDSAGHTYYFYLELGT